MWPDCLNFKHWPILSSASGALLIFTVKSALNYTRVLRQSTTTKKKKKKKKESINYTQIRRRCMRHLIRTYTVWELIYQIWDRQTVRWSKQKRRGRKRVCSSGAFFYPLSKATFDLLDTPTAPGCFAVSVYSHVSHKRINYQTTVTDDSC